MSTTTTTRSSGRSRGVRRKRRTKIRRTRRAERSRVVSRRRRTRRTGIIDEGGGRGVSGDGFFFL